MPGLASIGGAFIANRGARRASREQSATAQRDLNFQRQTRDLARSDLAPWRTGGADAQAALDFELGLRDRPTFGANPDGTGGTVYGGFTKTPGYDFRMRSGMEGLEASAAARGGLNSGAAMRDAISFNQDLASQEYGNYLARLAGRADAGMSAAAGQATAAQTAANGVSNALAGIGNARAAGAIRGADAMVGGLQNMFTGWNYQRAMGGQPGTNGNGNFFNGLFGGRGLGGFV